MIFLLQQIFCVSKIAHSFSLLLSAPSECYDPDILLILLDVLKQNISIFAYPQIFFNAVFHDHTLPDVLINHAVLYGPVQSDHCRRKTDLLLFITGKIIQINSFRYYRFPVNII